MASASGDLVAVGKDAKQLIGLFSSLLVPYYGLGMSPQGNRPVWLTAEAYVAPSDDNRLKVPLRFINSGKQDIVLRSPDQWKGRYNPMGSGFTFVGMGAGTTMDTHGRQLFQALVALAQPQGKASPMAAWSCPSGNSAM